MPKFDFLYEDPSSTNNASGSTPYGIYDADVQFQSESLQVCIWELNFALYFLSTSLKNLEFCRVGFGILQ